VRVTPGICAVAALLLPLARAQQPDPLPSAKSVFEHYVAVTGGQAAYDRVQNQITVMTIRRAGEVVARTQTIQTRDGRFRAITNGGGQNEETGLNDGIAWSKKLDSADLLDEGEERDAVQRSAVLLAEGRWQQFYTESEVVGIDTVSGKTCYVVTAVPFAGRQQALWFEKETGQLAKQVVAGLDDESETTFLFGDYADAAGIWIAKSATLTAHGVTLAVTVDSVQFDQALPDSTFAVPAEIARLITKRAAQ
jgi:outer membrane lipoprotein-sorting protein